MFDFIEAHYIAHKSHYKNKVIGRVGHHVAEEIVQEAYTRALEYAENCRSTDEFDQWFTTIFNNCVKQHSQEEKLRGATAKDAEVLSETGEDQPTPEDQLEMSEDLSAMVEQIDKQPEHIKGVLNLYFVHGYNYKEITKVLPLTYINVRKIVSRFRKDHYEDRNV